MKTFKTFFIEKIILGIIEQIEIPEIGTFSAKLDTGNGGYNVIHGESIVISEDQKTVKFKTINNIMIMKPILETIKINVGGGNYEDRPVVSFNLEIGSSRYNNVPFSISDRGTNSQKVLISKSFIQNDLNALIDVSKENNANKNEEIDTN